MDNRTLRGARDSLHRGIDKVEYEAEHIKDNVAVAVHKGVTVADHIITVQAQKLRNEISPYLPTISYSGIGFVASLPLSYYFNCLSIRKVVGNGDLSFPTNTISVALLRFLIDLVRITAQSPVLNTYYFHQPNVGNAVKWGIYLALQPISYALNTITVKMLSVKTPVTGNEIYQQTIGNEGYGGLMHGIFSQILKEVVLKPLVFTGLTALMFQTLKWDVPMGKFPASVAVHALTALITYPLVVNKRRQQQKTHKGVCTVGQMITNEYEEFTFALKNDPTSLWTGFGYHLLSLVPSLALMGAAETVAKTFVDHYYTLPSEHQYLWPRILYRVWSLL